jgi:uncharacterized membrane protein (Fun14 family)
MDKVERSHLCLSLLSGAVLGLAIGMALHWSIGVFAFIAWVVVHGLTWGFAPANAAHDELRKPDPETLS